MLAFAALCALALAALYLVMVQTEPGQDLDASAYSGPELEPGLGADQASTLLRMISIGTLAAATILLALLAVIRRRPWLALVAVAVIGGSVLVTEALKLEILSRPDLLPAGGTTNTFPSGHTAVGTSLGVAALLVVPVWLRPAALLGAIFYASAIGVATVAAGWHRPSDVVGSYLVTVGIAALVLAIIGRRAAEEEPAAAESERRTPGAVALGVVIGLIGLFAIAIAENARDVDWTTIDRGFVAFAIVLPLFAAALIGALAWLAWAEAASARLGRREKA